MPVATYTKAGAKATTPVKLSKSIFEVEIKNHELLKTAYVGYLSNQRNNYAKAKTRADVSGGGRKPWAQKGTGRARFGSSRNPIWRSGGAAFGPTGNETYTKALPVKAKRLALRQALTLAAASDKVTIIEDFLISDGKTQSAAKLLNKIQAAGRTLVVLNEINAATIRAVNNLSDARTILVNQLNTFEVLNVDKLIITKAALEGLEQRLGVKA